MFNPVSSNFNAYARQSTLQISNSKEINSAQNATQGKEANPTPNSQGTTSSNLVLDKSEAVSQILGYGVDSIFYERF